MAKKDLIDALNSELDILREELHRLRQEADRGFKASPEYNRMEQELKFYKAAQSLAETHLVNEIKADRALRERIKKIREDNVNLCAEHGAGYWEGITAMNKLDYSEVEDCEERILELESRIKAKDLIIEHYRDLLCGREPAKPVPAVMGRRPISDDQKDRIRELRRKGYTLKDISSMEGVSLGAVSGICKEIKKPSITAKKSKG